MDKFFNVEKRIRVKPNINDKINELDLKLYDLDKCEVINFYYGENDIKKIHSHNYRQKNNVINIPPHIKTMYFHYKIKLSEFTSEYDNLLKLSCDGCLKLSKSIKFPPNLIELSCKHNYIQKMVDLPQNLIKLNCSHNKIKSLDNLPTGLKYLNCSHCEITRLDNLPLGLLWLECKYNHNLTNLDYLPNNLVVLIFSGGITTKLDNLPSGLKFLSIGDAKALSNIGYIPSKLEFLDLYDCVELKCIAKMPDTMRYFSSYNNHNLECVIFNEYCPKLNCVLCDGLYYNKIVLPTPNYFSLYYWMRFCAILLNVLMKCCCTCSSEKMHPQNNLCCRPNAKYKIFNNELVFPTYVLLYELTYIRPILDTKKKSSYLNNIVCKILNSDTFYNFSHNLIAITNSIMCATLITCSMITTSIIVLSIPFLFVSKCFRNFTKLFGFN